MCLILWIPVGIDVTCGRVPAAPAPLAGTRSASPNTAKTSDAFVAFSARREGATTWARRRTLEAERKLAADTVLFSISRLLLTDRIMSVA